MSGIATRRKKRFKFFFNSRNSRFQNVICKQTLIEISNLSIRQKLMVLFPIQLVSLHRSHRSKSRTAWWWVWNGYGHGNTAHSLNVNISRWFTGRILKLWILMSNHKIEYLSWRSGARWNSVQHKAGNDFHMPFSGHFTIWHPAKSDIIMDYSMLHKISKFFSSSPFSTRTRA